MFKTDIDAAEFYFTFLYKNFFCKLGQPQFIRQTTSTLFYFNIDFVYKQGVKLK